LLSSPQKRNGTTLRRTVKNIFNILIRKERSQAVRLIIMDVAASLLDIFFLAALIYVIHFYTAGNHAVSFSFFPFTLFSKYPLSLIIVFFILFACKNWFGYLVFKMQYKFVYAVATRLSKRNLLYYLEGHYHDHVHIDSSVHIHKITHQPIEFGHHVLAGFQQIVGQSILIILTITAILIYSPVLFLLLFLILTPPLIVLGILIKRKLKAIRSSAKPFKERSVQHLQEALSGYVESNMFQRNDFFVDRYIKYQAAFNNFLSQQLVLQNLPSRFMEVFALFGLLTLIVLNLYSNNSGTIQVVTIGAFMAAAYKIIPGIVKILNSIGQIKTYGYTITNLLQNQAIVSTEKKESNNTIASLSMKNIFFSHKEEKLLNNFSMEIGKGELLGITAVSGRGKTTVINLILGFLNPQSGSICVNGKATTATDRHLYRKNIAYVKQDPFLIYDSILTNIILDENNYDKHPLEDALKASGVDVLASQYPQGLNSIITESGKNISGGQRQRIAMARALYKDADLLILDEPFNELDRESENKLLEHCRQLAADGKLIILITHNKESLSFCSKIISLDGN
jgi:ABC-type multidrug transport system fused ATPase/permease subunit